MDIQTVTQFFMWCSIINGGLLVLWGLFFILAPDLMYKTQRLVTPLTREQFDPIFYTLLGLFKIVFLVFNLVPFIALKIIG